MTRLVLHVGVGKTGTTSLQKSVFPNHSQIDYLGKYYPSDMPKNCRSMDVYEALKPVLWPKLIEIRTTNADAALRKIVSECESDRKVVVGSWEGLGTAPPRRFKSLLKRLETAVADSAILISLRNPVDWLPSIYLQSLRGHFNRSSHLKNFADAVYMPIEEWLHYNVGKMALSDWLSHAQNVLDANHILGAENVCVVLFEELRTDPEAYYRRIADFLDINGSEAVELAQGVHQNTRLSQAELEYIQRVQKSPTLRSAWRTGMKQAGYQTLNEVRAANPESVSASVKLDQTTRAWVENELRANYGRLERELGLDLGHYGYPV